MSWLELLRVEKAKCLAFLYYARLNITCRTEVVTAARTIAPIGMHVDECSRM